ncbi:MAG: NFACT family protein [Anaerolineae bacterium]|nr:NFACT family protein [Anaerolineae bacterium]
MTLDALTLKALADELAAQLVGGRVQAITPADALTLVFEVYRGQRHYLLVSADPQAARVHLGDKGRRGVERETPFLLLLRKFVKEARVTAITTPPWERMLEIHFSGVEGDSRLVVELMGRLSNTILVDEAGLVRDSARRITPEMTRARVVLPRQPYMPPPRLERPTPDELTHPLLEALIAGAPADRPLWRLLSSGLAGLSPLAGREIAFRALGDAESAVGAVERLDPILHAVADLVAPARWSADTDAPPQSLIPNPSVSPWSPTVVREEEAVVAFAPYRLTHLPDAEPIASLSEAIAAYFAAQVGRDAYAAARARVEALMTAARDRAQRHKTALEREIVSAEEIERRREWGEWLLAYAYAVPRGATEFTVEDTGAGPLTIPLDPKLTPVENAQRHFREYERAKRAAADLDTRQDGVHLTLATLDQLLTDLQLAENRPEIDAVHAQFAAFTGEKAPQTRGGKPAGPLDVVSPDGLTILVGRNSRQNDSVTFERARPHDLWLHARGVPGAHVIIRTEGRPTPDATLLAAASLAAYYSAARGSTSVAVDMTEVRRVKRLKGGGPGLVTYTDERTLHAPPLSVEEFIH